jgi:hypothetical protein
MLDPLWRSQLHLIWQEVHRKRAVLCRYSEFGHTGMNEICSVGAPDERKAYLWA